MDSNLEQYVYSQLPAQHIRLLYLNASTTLDQKPSWSIRIIPIIESQISVPFDALSYTWGSLSTTYLLEVDGRELQIHHNLYHALPYLSCRPSGLPLWIDAVCINQNDEVEKLVQIRLMSDIYRGAAKVWVWLGIAEGPGFTEAINEVLPRIDKISTRLLSLRGEQTLLPSEVNLPDLDSPMWDALDEILNNSWFLRLWIVQEAALARDISCLLGSHVIEWKVLEEAVNSTAQLGRLQDAHNRKPKVSDGPWSSNAGVFYCRNTYQDWFKAEDNKPYSLQELVMGICNQVLNHKCFDPRDRVLAMFGFVGSDHENDIKVDENTSLPDLYAEFVQFILQGTGGFPVYWWQLINVAIDDQKSEGITSWCPDLHHARTFWKLPLPLASEGPYEASGKDINSRRGANCREMVLEGTNIDEIRNVGPDFDAVELDEYEGRSFVSWLLKLIYWRSSVHALVFDSNKWTKTNPAKKEYWTTLIGNSSDYGRPRPLTFQDFVSFQSALDDFETITEKVGPEKILEYYESHEIGDVLAKFRDDGVAHSALMAIKDIQSGRRLFVTVNDRLGFGNSQIIPGDQICIFDGSPIAHVIRDINSSSEEKKYTLVSEAYLHGAMNGEVDEWALEGQEITLV